MSEGMVQRGPDGRLFIEANGVGSVPYIAKHGSYADRRRCFREECQELTANQDLDAALSVLTASLTSLHDEQAVRSTSDLTFVYSGNPRGEIKITLEQNSGSETFSQLLEKIRELEMKLFRESFLPG